MATGVDDDATLRANREGFQKFHLRPRRLVDVGTLDTKMELFGETYASPIVVSPTGSNRAFHDDGELAVSRGARAGNHLTMLSTVATTSIEDAIAARGAPVWFQLYATSTFNVAKQLVEKAERAGCPVVAVTVDRVAGRNQEAFERLRKVDKRNCADCHKPGIEARAKKLPNYEGVDIKGLSNMLSSNMTWDFIKRLRDTTKMKVMIKGVLTAEDAQLAVQNGLDGVIVSNHGARSEDSGRATIDILPEVLAETKGKIVVLVDSGFRRGTDVAKAMAMGANAVGVGRPYLWGLGAFGEPGVAKVLEILRTEFSVAMAQCGVAKVKDFTPAFVRRV